MGPFEWRGEVDDLHSGERTGLQKRYDVWVEHKVERKRSLQPAQKREQCVTTPQWARTPKSDARPPVPGILQGVGGDRVDVDDEHRAELEFAEESEITGTHATGQLNADACKYERALNSIDED